LSNLEPHRGRNSVWPETRVVEKLVVFRLVLATL
jgi:hypothetical protein